MPDTEQQIVTLFLTSALITLVLVLLVILFVVIYQRRGLQQKTNLRFLEAEHRLALLDASMQAQEEAQARIAKDLHDDLGALLSTTKLHVSRFGQKNKELPNVEGHTTQVKDLLTEGLVSVRRIVNDLLPPTLRDFGLRAAIEEVALRVNGAEGLHLEVRYSWDTGRLDPSIELPLFRITQELVNNTLKHAAAQNAKLHLLLEPEAVILEYGDDGKGFDPEQIKRNLGLRNMESRAALLNGTILYESTPGKGFRAIVEIPISK